MSQQVPQQPFYPQQELPPQQPPPQGPMRPGPQPPQPKKRRRWVPWAVASGTFVLGLVIGAAPSGGTASTSAGTPQATATETVQAPGSTVTVTAPPVNVTAPPVTVTAPPVTVTKPAPPAKTVTAAPPEAAATFEGDGTYEVGVDIKPGKYKSTGGEGCYWARLKNLDGDLDAILANNLSDGPQTVTIKKTDKGFETSNCAAWRKVA
ncbi:hypothetical protein EV649_1160 [Kribbella sp. VKM Ac-2569]|uniref:hypothetical protein n=1 Tax=Kribbella sp. VKM Ac-2569 TaxID=2512220 RepID=UPI00102B7ADA|nr:hypothetical protein [Kribbella sp. VKM Ac-2569]RZT27400.1 hypothetical protein EV649_1160 [Kribbella sp. VKM Ac-2569]